MEGTSIALRASSTLTAYIDHFAIALKKSAVVNPDRITDRRLQSCA
jgi:hypothetical protein